MPDFQQLLQRTSRTFSLSIQLLDEPSRSDLQFAYLLFRVADTLEDADLLSPGERIQALEDFCGCLHAAPEQAAAALVRRWRPTRNADYIALLHEFPALLAAIGQLEPAVSNIMLHHARRTAQSMASFVARARPDGSLVLDSVVELRAYCYAVAGIVGEMITELFLFRHCELQGHEQQLRRHAVRFGEALQLVNILKDAEDDREQGRIYLPFTVARGSILELARQSLLSADAYVTTLRSALPHSSLVGFAELLILLARGTLDRVEEQGAGAKLTRSEVTRLLKQVDSSEAGYPSARTLVR